MKEKRSRRQFTNEEKAAILKRHLIDKIPVSDPCEKHHIRSSLFYPWQRQAWENLGTVFENGGRPYRRSGREESLSRTVEQFKADLTARDAKPGLQRNFIAPDHSPAFLNPSIDASTLSTGETLRGATGQGFRDGELPVCAETEEVRSVC